MQNYSPINSRLLPSEATLVPTDRISELDKVDKMYFKKRRKIDSWSTDNCCVKWSLRTGTLIIAYVTLIGLGLTTAVFCWMTYTCWGVYLKNCTIVPEPERKIIDVVTSDGYEFDIDVILCLFSMFFATYFFMAFLVIIGTYKKIPKLLQGWVHCTMTMMIYVFFDLIVTLPFTNLYHLATCFTLFVVSLYTWAVVRSHMIVLLLEHYAIALPPAEFRKFAADEGIDLDALDEEAV